MPATRLLMMGLMATLFGAGYAFGNADGPDLVASAEAAPLPPQTTHVFELRTYTAPEGKLDDLLARFRNHTMRIFDNHGMRSVGYWIPQDPELSENTLVYLLEHPSREAGEQAWRDFSADPEWQRVSEESQRDGRIVTSVVRQWLDPTDFSPIR